jgi:hypothetical protein
MKFKYGPYVPVHQKEPRFEREQGYQLRRVALFIYTTEKPASPTVRFRTVGWKMSIFSRCV